MAKTTIDDELPQANQDLAVAPNLDIDEVTNKTIVRRQKVKELLQMGVGDIHPREYRGVPQQDTEGTKAARKLPNRTDAKTRHGVIRILLPAP